MGLKVLSSWPKNILPTARSSRLRNLKTMADCRSFTSTRPQPKQLSAPASYYRGGTSRAVIFQAKDIPENHDERRSMFLQIMGSPDPNGRQLNGMGAGISSLSKICIISPSTNNETDVDYTFVGIGIEDEVVDLNGNCGNMSAAVGPFAFNNRLLGKRTYDEDGMAEVKILNTNTNVIIKSTFPVADGEAVTAGDFTIDGVGGSGAQITLDFLRPGGSKTGKLLPSGNVTDTIDGIETSIIDSANPCVFLTAEALGVSPTILPNDFNKLTDKLARLENIRSQAAVMMGLCKSSSEVPRVIPKIAIVSPPVSQITLSGVENSPEELDLVVRFISDAQPHRAIPLTGALCTASAAKINGSIVEKSLRGNSVKEGMVTIGHSSGKIQVSATISSTGDVECATVFRTARRIMEGRVFWNA